MKKTIELDCAPGGIRPGDLIGKVIEGTGLKNKEHISCFFGNWIWDYNEVSDEDWLKIQPILMERITDLYNKGIIRYGSW